MNLESNGWEAGYKANGESARVTEKPNFLLWTFHDSPLDPCERCEEQCSKFQRWSKLVSEKNDIVKETVYQSLYNSKHCTGPAMVLSGRRYIETRIERFVVFWMMYIRANINGESLKKAR